MRTKGIIFDGKPGSGPEPETDPQPFGVEMAPGWAERFKAGQEAPAERPQPPVKRGPGRPRKSGGAKG